MSKYLGFEATNQKPYYFLSYDSTDAVKVSKYAKAFAAHGINIWYDDYIKDNDKWEQIIEENIKNCEEVIMVLTKSVVSRSNSFVKTEYELADIYEKNVHAVLVEDITKKDIAVGRGIFWSKLCEKQYLDARNIPVNECAEKLRTKLPKIFSSVYSENAAKMPKDEVADIPNEGIYHGALSRNKRHGNGVMRYLNGDEYEGGWQENLRSGKGVLRCSDNNVYNGEYYLDKRHGNGIYTCYNCYQYIGDWENDQMHGHGIITWANEDSYDGDFYKGKRHGKGAMHWKSGAVYEGEWSNDKPCGKGTMCYADKSVYNGSWKNGLPNGEGEMLYCNGYSYSGDWVNGKAQGCGKLTDASGKTVHKGLFADNEPSYK